MPLAFRAICPYCGYEIPTAWTKDEDMWWFERDPNAVDPIAAFEEDMERKIGRGTAWRVITADGDPEEFFNGLRCPACGHYMVPAFKRKEG